MDIIIGIVLILLLVAVGIIYHPDVKPSYDDLLRTEEWRSFRWRIIKKHGGRCDWCGSHEHLQVHHRYYLKDSFGRKVLPWEYPDSAMMVLCDSCHRRCHERYNIRVYLKKHL